MFLVDGLICLTAAAYSVILYLIEIFKNHEKICKQPFIVLFSFDINVASCFSLVHY